MKNHLLCRAMCFGLLLINSIPLAADGIYDLSIPSGHLGRTGFKVTARGHYFSTTRQTGSGDTTVSTHLPYNFSLAAGLGARTEVDFEFGNSFSMAFRALVLDSEDEQFIPSVILGVRSLYHSQEAFLYRVGGYDSLNGLTNEPFVSLVSNLSQSTSVHAGLVGYSRTENWPVSLYAGLTQNVGGAMSVGYETYQRFSSFHHNVYFFQEFFNSFSISLGVMEVQSWLVQKGAFGPHFSPKGLTNSGYDNPGLSLSVSYRYGKKPVREELDKDKLARLEKEHRATQAEVEKIWKEVRSARGEINNIKKSKSMVRQMEQDRIGEYLTFIAAKVNSDHPFDPVEVSELQKKILEMKGKRDRVLGNIAQDVSKGVSVRAQAIVIMGISRKSGFDRVLIQSTQDPEPEIRREAILALGKMSKKIAQEQAENLLDDPDASVVLAARQILNGIKVKSSGESEDMDDFSDVP